MRFIQCSKADAKHFVSNPASHQRTLLILQLLLMSTTQCTCLCPMPMPTQYSVHLPSACTQPSFFFTPASQCRPEIDQLTSSWWQPAFLQLFYLFSAPFPLFFQQLSSIFPAAPLCWPPASRANTPGDPPLPAFATQSNRIKGQKDVSSMTLKSSSASTSFYLFHASVPALSLKALNYWTKEFCKDEG